ncbi:MAG: hypothetical protein WA728_04450 [Xanthobacteraceae bacterium]
MLFKVIAIVVILLFINQNVWQCWRVGLIVKLWPGSTGRQFERLSI